MRHTISGVPKPQRWVVSTVGGRYNFAGGPTSWLQVFVHSGTVRLYFTQAAYDADAAAAALPGNGEEVLELTDARPYDGPVWAGGVYLRAVPSDATVTLIPFMQSPGMG